MEKYYKKFYEVGNNRYYGITADDENFIATETFIKIGTKRFSKKPKFLTEGLKLLKITIPTVILFAEMLKLEKDVKIEDLQTYKIPSSKDITKLIKDAYNASNEESIIELNNWYNEICEQIKNNNELNSEQKASLKKTYKERKDRAAQNIKANAEISPISLKRPQRGQISIIDKMLDENCAFLYSERITGFVTEYYLYDLDRFGTLTIYKITTVKDVVKSIDTFIYNLDVIDEYMNMLEKEGA